MNRIFLCILSVLLLINCSTTQNDPDHNVKEMTIDINRLSKNQVCIEDKTKGLPGKCYAKFKYQDDELMWCEVFCQSQAEEASRIARECLEELGYELINDQGFETENGNALVDFQMKNDLRYGAFDEATLYLLLLATQ